MALRVVARVSPRAIFPCFLSICPTLPSSPTASLTPRAFLGTPRGESRECCRSLPAGHLTPGPPPSGGEVIFLNQGGGDFGLTNT